MIVCCEALELLRNLDENELDFCVTDPPYGLGKPPDMHEVLKCWFAGKEWHAKGRGFSGHSWDKFVPGPELWKELLRVLKPGAHAAVFAGTRTQDLMGLALRLAGFEIRDTIMWLYGSGMIKSRNIALDDPELVDAAAGRGTNLKPSYEPVILVRKPLEGTIAETFKKYGTGTLNLDGCRVERGTLPPNVALDEESAQLLDQQSGNRPGMSGGGKHKTRRQTIAGGGHDGNESHIRGDQGGASRFMYCPKTSRAEREAGLTEENMLCNCSGEELTKWAKEGRNPRMGSLDLRTDTSQRRGTSDSGEEEDTLWPTDGSGNSTTERSPLTTTSTTSTKTLSTTGLRTSPSSTKQPTSASTVGANSEKESGGSLAGSAKSSSRLAYAIGISAQRGGRCTEDVGLATSRLSSALSSLALCEICDKWCSAPSAGAITGGREEGSVGLANARAGSGRTRGGLNIHNTVKPIALMRWLVRLVAPPGEQGDPPEGIDPFLGSGTSAVAAALEGVGLIGCDREPEYVEIAKARLAHWRQP